MVSITLWYQNVGICMLGQSAIMAVQCSAGPLQVSGSWRC